MLRTQRPRGGERAQTAMPSQAPSTLTPFFPGPTPGDMSGMGELQKPHKHGYGGPPPVYVISTYDARPINACDFNTYSGTNAGGAANPDTGWHPLFAPDAPGPFLTSSLFYTAQAGRVAVVRDWQITISPNTGQELGGELGNPVFYPPGGISNFRIVLDFLVDGTFQESMSGRVIWAAAFGDVAGECYILAQPGQTIEMRITGSAPPPATQNTTWNAALMSMHGNLLLSEGLQLEFEPGTRATLPVHEQAQISAPA